MIKTTLATILLSSSLVAATNQPTVIVNGKKTSPSTNTNEWTLVYKKKELVKRTPTLF